MNFNFGFFLHVIFTQPTLKFVYFFKTPVDVTHTTVFSRFFQLKDVIEKCFGNRAFSLNVMIKTSSCHNKTGEALFLFSHRG